MTIYFSFLLPLNALFLIITLLFLYCECYSDYGTAAINYNLNTLLLLYYHCQHSESLSPALYVSNEGWMWQPKLSTEVNMVIWMKISDYQKDRFDWLLALNQKLFVKVIYIWVRFFYSTLVILLLLLYIATTTISTTICGKDFTQHIPLHIPRRSPNKPKPIPDYLPD